MPPISPAQAQWLDLAEQALDTVRQDDLAVAKARYEADLKRLGPTLVKAARLEGGAEAVTRLAAAQAAARDAAYERAHGELRAAARIATGVLQAQGPAGEGGAAAPDGLIGKPLAAYYEDEQYRRNPDGRVAHGGEFRGAGNQRTKYYNEAEAENSKLRVGADGKLLEAEGDLGEDPADKTYAPVGAGKRTAARGFVVDAESGQVHQFAAGTSEMQGDHQLNTHHSSPIQGRDAAAAGNLRVLDGVVREIDDHSGHYAPGADQTHQFVASLQEQGVQMRDQSLAMFDAAGNVVRASPELAALHQEVQQYEADRAARPKDEQGPDGPQMAAKLARLRAAGVGPTQRDAKVSVVDDKTKISEVEFIALQGSQDALRALMREKLGDALYGLEAAGVPDRIARVRTAQEANNQIAIILRIAAGQGVAGEFSQVKFGAEGASRFVQTQGNLDAVKAKAAAGDEIKRRAAAAAGATEGAADPDAPDAPEAAGHPVIADAGVPDDDAQAGGGGATTAPLRPDPGLAGSTDAYSMLSDEQPIAATDAYQLDEQPPVSTDAYSMLPDEQPIVATDAYQLDEQPAGSTDAYSMLSDEQPIAGADAYQLDEQPAGSTDAYSMLSDEQPIAGADAYQLDEQPPVAKDPYQSDELPIAMPGAHAYDALPADLRSAANAAALEAVANLAGSPQGIQGYVVKPPPQLRALAGGSEAAADRLGGLYELAVRERAREIVVARQPSAQHPAAAQQEPAPVRRADPSAPRELKIKKPG